MALNWPDVPIPTSRARTELTLHAWDTDDDRTIIHCRLGGIGADHDLHTALDLLGRAKEVLWITSMLHHDLAVVVEEDSRERIYCYDVPRPERRRTD